MELDIDVDIERFENTSSVVFSNSQSNVLLILVVKLL